MQAWEKKSATFEKCGKVFHPLKARLFITDLCSSSLESMVVQTPTLFKCSKLRVYTLLIEIKLNDL